MSVGACKSVSLYEAREMKTESEEAEKRHVSSRSTYTLNTKNLQVNITRRNISHA